MAAMRGFMFCLAIVTLVSIPMSTTAATIGINYGRLGNNLPSSGDVVRLLQSRGVSHVRIYDSDHEVMAAFQPSGIKLSPMVTNGEVEGIASSQDTSNGWVTQNISPFASMVDRISVGNEWLHSGGDVSRLVLAMENLQRSLQNAGLSGIKLTTPHAFDVQGYPPSQGAFADANAMGAILQFLKNTGSVFELNVYPFFAYRDTASIGIDYAVFNPNSAHLDDNGKQYVNLFDAMVDTFLTAMQKLGFDLQVVISETGWPTVGDGRGVGIENAKTYNNNLVKHVLGNQGTPVRPGVNFETYIFALFNENEKEAGIEQNWGLFYPDKSPVYDVNLSV